MYPGLDQVVGAPLPALAQPVHGVLLQCAGHIGADPLRVQCGERHAVLDDSTHRRQRPPLAQRLFPLPASRRDLARAQAVSTAAGGTYPSASALCAVSAAP